MLRHPLFSAAGATLGFALATPVLAQRAGQVLSPATGGAATQQQAKAPATLTGEWGGLRARLRNDGIDLTAGYTSEFAANVQGGERHDATETGQFAFGVKLDTDKLFGLKGGALQATITFRRGHDLGERAGLNNLQQVQEVYGRGQTRRLTELWYQQQLGGRLDIKAGRLAQGADFSSFSCTFENLSFCGAPAGNIAGDYWYNYPVAQWGARLRLRHSEWYVMAGGYENNPHNLNNDFAISHGGATGALVPIEAGWTPYLGSHHLPGSYRFGGWYNSSNAPDVLLGANHEPFAVNGVNPLQRRGRYGAYMLLQQQLTGTYSGGPDGPKATHGLSIFINVTQTDRNTERTDNQIAAGLFFVGPSSGRPNDDLGFGVARTHVNTRAALSELILTRGTARARSEYDAELYYSAHLRPWLIVRPTVQYVIDPGGYNSARNLVVFGFKSAITF